MAGANAEFSWLPGVGADREALQRIRQAYPCPAKAMGEAWFMGERRRFPELLGSLDGLTNTELADALGEIVRGGCYFGPRDEWRDWHHYLLTERYSRIHEPYPLLEVFISGLFAIYPNGIENADLRRDMLLTVGRSLMEPECWPEGQTDPERCLGISLSDCGDALTDSFKLSAALFFCLKHLSRAEVGPWMRSVLDIQDPLWRAQLIVFAAEAHPVLTGGRSAHEHFTGRGSRGLYWDGTEILASAAEFSRYGWWPSPDNRLEAVEAFRLAFTGGVPPEWAQAIQQAYPAVWAALDEAPDQCRVLYGN